MVSSVRRMCPLWNSRVARRTNSNGKAGSSEVQVPTATSADASATGAAPYTGLSSGIDLSGLWKS